MTYNSESKMLKVNEIYLSVQGESSYTGLPCVFIRLTGCNLRCIWCDTAYAFYEGKSMSIDEIVGKVKNFGVKLIEITGGEPLMQENLYPLMNGLIEKGFQVLLETGGSLSLEKLPRNLIKIMDISTFFKAIINYSIIINNC